MAKEYTEYLEMDGNYIKTLKCMNCEKVIGRRKEKKDGSLVLVRFVSAKTVNVDLEDGSYASLQVCSKCVSKPLDLKKLEKTMKWGWQQDMKYLKYPLTISRYKKTFEGKRILSRSK